MDCKRAEPRDAPRDRGYFGGRGAGLTMAAAARTAAAAPTAGVAVGTAAGVAEKVGTAAGVAEEAHPRTVTGLPTAVMAGRRRFSRVSSSFSAHGRI